MPHFIIRHRDFDGNSQLFGSELLLGNGIESYAQGHKRLHIPS